MTPRIAALGMLLLAPVTVESANVTRYDLVSKGFTVGHVRTERSRVDRDGRPCVRCTVTTDVKVNLFFFSYALHAKETSLASDRGAIEYTREATEDGVHMETRGRLQGDTFHFEIVRNGATSTVDVATNTYDVTSMDNVELQLPHEGDARTWRVLELQDAAVAKRSYSRLPFGRVTTGTRPVECVVVEFRDPDRNARRWITTDDLGMVILRQDGTDKAGSYSMRWSGEP